MNRMIKIVMGTALSVIFMAVVYVVVAKFVMTEISGMSQEMVHNHQQRIEQRQSKVAEEQRLKEEAARLQSEQTAQAQALAAQKESLWFKWYKEPEGCNSFQSDEHMVECVNHKMRSKAEFNNLWDQGKIDATSL